MRQDLIRTGGQREREWSELKRAAFLQSTLIQKIQDNLDYDNQYFAIGISASHNVKNRTAQYYPQRDGWTKGYVKLHESTNPLNILALEDDCIEAFRSSEFLTNQNGGGGGLIDTEHASWKLYLKKAERKPSEHWYAKNKKSSNHLQ